MSIRINHILITLCGSITLQMASLFAVDLSEHAPNPNDIQVVPVDPTPEPDSVELRLQFPHEYELKKELPIHAQMRLDWYPLGVDSEFPRKDEIFNDSEGQSIHIFIDNYSYFEIDEALFDAVDDHDEYYDQTVEFDIPFKLEPGMHVIRAFPCRSFGESLKGPKCFVSSVFYYQNKDNNINVDLTKPFITYNEPQGNYEGGEKPILLDFYISNCTLSKDGYKVRLTLDGENQRFLTSWQPYYIYGLKKGLHKVRIELLDPQNKLVPGAFNSVEKTISVH
jgi:hypothetical protein